MSFNEIDDTLVAYFKQMLEEEMPKDSTTPQSQDNELNVEVAPAEVTTKVDVATSEDGPDYLNHEDPVQTELQVEDPIAENTEIEVDEPVVAEPAAEPVVTESEPVVETTSEYHLEPQAETKDETQTSQALPFAEHQSLQSLLADLENKVETKTETQTQTVVETKVETQVQEETKTETNVAVSATTTKEKDTTTDTKEDVSSVPENPYEWKNIEMPNEFQALFFLVKGIRFAVPLVNLGGIFQCDKVTPLFGKPNWFMGIADVRGKKMNVVDTLRWVKPDAPKSDIYEYMIVLDKTLWSVGCDVLEGNRILSKDQVTWRETAGNRPWLAGIVKKEMCALLHVEALIKMFENGVNLKDLDAQVCE